MIRFGIAGFGLHAVKRLMPGFNQAERCRVTALSRRDPEKARHSAADFQIPLTFNSTPELCQSDEVDAVFVASPDALHLPDVLSAIQYGKPVLCEKPLAMNAGEALRMVETAGRAGVTLGVAQVFRFEESTRLFRKHVAQGEIGRPLFARAEFCYSGFQHPRKWLNDPQLACGGPIADVGVHCIDTLRFILQDEPTSISTLAASDEASGPFEASALLTLEFREGALATVAVSTRSDYRSCIEIVGEEGVLTADDALNVEHPVTVELRRKPGDPLMRKEEVTNHLAYARQVDAFAAAVEEGREFEIPGEEGFRNQLIVDAAYLSRETGRSEPIEG